MLYNGFFNDKNVYINTDNPIDKSEIDLILRQLNSTYKKKSLWTFSTPDQIGIIKSISVFVDENIDKFASIINYNKHSDKFDISCLIDGLAIKLIDMKLQDLGCWSYVINIGYNTLYRNVLDCMTPLYESSSLVHKLEIEGKSSLCVFKAQRNALNKYQGSQMLPNGWSLVIVSDVADDPVFYDILTTALYTNTSTNFFTNDIKDIFVFDDQGHITLGTYFSSDLCSKLTSWEKRQVYKDFPQLTLLNDYSEFCIDPINNDKSKKLLYVQSSNTNADDFYKALDIAKQTDCTLIIYDPEAHQSQIITESRKLKTGDLNV